ncbi:HlyD family secretion protein [Rhodovastum atsumiense]|uniref:HlyD family secretion protein n=1 Tax=Rhodovastum atsumiense TaxID=504468 RepID=A0A5M6IPB3_9PROT|nr:HlyD family secretion protein [Rhodovastum atsumiense]KAA5609739.1 HlyD family secretion protein [Rhodovastum atsumiense]CAH2604511.1 HlyD family secretion protein [Rhodovastum atsumiense]
MQAVQTFSRAGGLPLSRQSLRRAATALLALGLLGGGGGYGWHWWQVGRFIRSTDDAYLQADAAIISPRVEGYVRHVAITDNQQVRAGDVLFVLDDRDYRARRDQARAAAAAATAAIGHLDAEMRQQRSMIAQAEAAIGSAVAERDRARLDQARYRALARDQAASRQAAERAEADLLKAEAALIRAQAAAGSERDRMPVLATARAQAEAQREGAAAALRLAEINLEDTVIRAPNDGVVGNRAAQLGQFVKPGSQLVTLVPLQSLYVTANFKETQLEHMRPGQPARIAVDAFPAHDLRGSVESFAPGTGAQFSLLPPENATGNFTKIVQRVPVRIRLDGAPADLAGRIRPGLSVVVAVDTGTAAIATAGAFPQARAGELR